ncbi:MAG: hypothetical protein BGO98_34360 [Myxococcales bacterium 68-20]|nr:MAG: hypothetical protein BGO98_34360 [Myxococcales bacterium 68-20]
MTKRLVASAFCAAALAMVFSCSHRTIEFEPPPAGPVEAPNFSGVDASADVEAESITYCASTTCTESTATCPDSRFPCDVDLKTDPRNCGACGVVCPGRRGNGEFACIEGACKMTCVVAAGRPFKTWADCNGLVDDDCETELGTNDNCKACGDTCADPANPCIRDVRGVGKQCGCDPGSLYCGGGCVDPKSSDMNCGACGVACDPTGGGAEAIANGYYGCAGGRCGSAKCLPNFADCDGNIANGCETSLLSPESCGGCGIACDPGQACVLNSDGKPECRCPTGKTLCLDVCVDLKTDPDHCGACLSACGGFAGPNAAAICSHGSCGVACKEGWADCNGNTKDGCETNLEADPSNCGACGSSCDLVAGQPCIAGRCAVEPCKSGEETK